MRLKLQSDEPLSNFAFKFNMRRYIKVPLDGFKALQGISGPQRFQIHKAGCCTSNPTFTPGCFTALGLGLRFRQREVHLHPGFTALDFSA